MYECPGVKEMVARRGVEGGCWVRAESLWWVPHATQTPSGTKTTSPCRRPAQRPLRLALLRDCPGCSLRVRHTQRPTPPTGKEKSLCPLPALLEGHPASELHTVESTTA